MKTIWHKPQEIPTNEEIVIVNFRGSLYIGEVYVYPNGKYSVTENNYEANNYWSSEIEGWCYAQDILNLK